MIDPWRGFKTGSKIMFMCVFMRMFKRGFKHLFKRVFMSRRQRAAAYQRLRLLLNLVGQFTHRTRRA